MRLPRDLSGNDLAKALESLDYAVSRQTGSHMRLTTRRDGEHHVTIPAHETLKVGTPSEQQCLFASFPFFLLA